MLRIQGGHAKGRALRSLPNNPLVRPILARIKKSLFDILRPRMKDARFLDIYAGTGAVGIEALSQGAKHACFIEQDPQCVRIVHENLEIFKFTNQSAVYRLNATGDLSVLPKGFNIIFMGPPYKDAAKTMLALVHPTLDAIERANLLAEGGIIIAQHHKKEITASTPVWEKVREEHYGDTTVSFFKRARA